MLDRPNERSSHSVPTPRGGGLGLVLAFLLAVVLSSWTSLGSVEACALVGVLLVAAIGWVDDHGGASVRARLAVHLTGAALLLPMLWSVPVLGLPLWASAAWWIFWTVAAVNVVNFMDGIDGIIGLQMLIYGGYVAHLALPDVTAGHAGLALAGASLGFLCWNWGPARIFMGDVGSGALGILVVVIGGALMRDGAVDLVTAFAPLAPLFLDATLTLVLRARRRERLSDAHRTHLYQRLANSRLGHRRVAVGFGCCSLACAVLATRATVSGWLLLPVLLAPCLLTWLAADIWLSRTARQMTR